MSFFQVECRRRLVNVDEVCISCHDYNTRGYPSPLCTIDILCFSLFSLCVAIARPLLDPAVFSCKLASVRCSQYNGMFIYRVLGRSSRLRDSPQGKRFLGREVAIRIIRSTVLRTNRSTPISLPARHPQPSPDSYLPTFTYLRNWQAAPRPSLCDAWKAALTDLPPVVCSGQLHRPSKKHDSILPCWRRSPGRSSASCLP